MTREQGFLMPMAMFIILVMGGMALTISRYTGQASVAIIQEVFNVQAFYAAESGAQYGMNQLLYDETQLMTPTLAQENCDAMVGPPTFGGVGLQDCTATVSCSSNLVSNVRYFTINSVGRCGIGTQFSAVRTVDVSSFIQ